MKTAKTSGKSYKCSTGSESVKMVVWRECVDRPKGPVEVTGMPAGTGT